MGEKRLWKLDQGLCVLLMLLIPLQLCLSIANLFYGIDKGYGHSFPLWSYVLSAAYLCVVLSADGFMICVGRLELSKFVGRYWLSACGALAAAALLRLVPEGGMIALLLLAYTPVLAGCCLYGRCAGAEGINWPFPAEKSHGPARRR